MKSLLTAITQTTALSLSMLLFAAVTLSACSNSNTNSTSNSQVKNIQKVETGKIVGVKTVKLKPEEINSYGNVGVGVNTGGKGGIYGSVDLATIGKLYRNATKPSTAQQIIVTKANGETIAITQPATKEVFKVGDAVKLLIVDGEARVIH